MFQVQKDNELVNDDIVLKGDKEQVALEEASVEEDLIVPAIAAQWTIEPLTESPDSDPISPTTPECGHSSASAAAATVAVWTIALSFSMSNFSLSMVG